MAERTTDAVAVLERLNPLRRPDPTALDLAADALAALSVGLAVVAVCLVLALVLTRRVGRADPRILRADALPERYRLPAYLRLLGQAGDPALYRPMPPGELETRTREARQQLEDAA